MADQSLLALLKKIRDGDVSAEIVGEARARLIEDGRLDVPVDELFMDDARGDAEALLGVIGDGPSLIAETLAAALANEAEDLPLPVESDSMVGDVMGALFEDDGQTVLPGMKLTNRPRIAGRPLASVSRETNDPDTVEAPRDEVFESGEGQFSLPLGDAVTSEAGTAPELAREHDKDALPVAVAVASEAGPHAEHGVPFDAEAVPVAEAVEAEAGPTPELAEPFLLAGVSVGDAVAYFAGAAPNVALTWASLPSLADAVASEAGASPDVAQTLAERQVPLAAAVAAVAGRVEVSSAVYEEVSGLPQVPVVEAITAAAGDVNVVDQVLTALGIHASALPEGWLSGLLDHELDDASHIRAAEEVARRPELGTELTALADLGRQVRESLTREAGDGPMVWHAVAKSIGIDNPDEVPGWEPEVLRSAVLEEAGPLADISEGVMETLLAPRDPIAVDEAVEVAPANDVSWSALIGVAAAAALLFIWVPNMFAPEAEEEFVPVVSQFAVTGEAFLEEVTAPDGTKVYVDFTSGEGQPTAIYLSNEGAP